MRSQFAQNETRWILAFYLNPASMQDLNVQNTLVELLTYVANANGDELGAIQVQCRNLLEQLG